MTDLADERPEESSGLRPWPAHPGGDPRCLAAPYRAPALPPQPQRTAVQAAARQRRDNLEREVNSAAHRVIATAARVSELAKEVPIQAKSLFALAGRSPVASPTAPYEQVMKLRQEAANEAVTARIESLRGVESAEPLNHRYLADELTV